MSSQGALLLAGGGHSHALLLKRWAMHPRTRPKRALILVNRSSTALYSGMVPGLIAGLYRRDEVEINLRHLCDRAGAAFISADIAGIDPSRRHLLLVNRPPLAYGLLSLNVGAISRPTAPGVPIKPLEPALAFLTRQDAEQGSPFRVIGAGPAGIEVVLALRRRWPQRPLELQTRPHQLGRDIQQAMAAAEIRLVSDEDPAKGPTLLCSGSDAPPWLSDCGLPVDDHGRVCTDACLNVVGHPEIFASGDCAVLVSDPRPASGVWAVRAAHPLARNLHAVCGDEAARPWRPQRSALQLIGDLSHNDQPRAWGRKGSWRLGSSSLLWQWKQRIDRRFMAGFQPKPSMQASMKRAAIDNDQQMVCRGCAAKLPAEPLIAALAEAGLATLGHSPADAAPIGGDPPMLQSVDGFPALVSDPWLNGRLTALHACSDLWASGARSTSAMAVITVPATDPTQQQQLLRQTLAGIHSALEQQGAALVGGHTLEARHSSPLPESLGVQVSLSVNGVAARVWSKQGMQAGDVLLLSRPLGTGVLFAAAMSGAADPRHLDAVLERMSESQHPLLDQLVELGEAVHACTDITGFGLLGHLGEMLAGSDLLLSLDATAIPAYDGVLELFARGFSSTLAPANRQALSMLDKTVSLAGQSSHGLRELLVDPQTCGPLLVSCSQAAATTLMTRGSWTPIGSAATAHG
ncbi:hypothetical protein KR100_02245 [Synechococcus sp. KORDI-100]|nr:selenide, water dikinase SelD [Synechococcus sp. KORDI-100]AII42224.1 hypothetical protein KR100_02245 [Synechococcus sp. KORDI-100]